MKIDYNKLRTFLEIFETSKSPIINTNDIFISLEYNADNQNDCEEILFYLKILNDQRLIECFNNNTNDVKDLGFSYTGRKELIIRIINFRLTNLGHQTLEAMKTNKIWEKIKGPLEELGIEGLKQIPLLAIQLLTLK